MQPFPYLSRALRQSARVLAIVLILIGCAALGSSVRADDDDVFPEGPGKAVLLKICTQCHAADSIAGQHRSRDEWKDTIDAMKGYGAEATDEELSIILDYLVKNFGKQ
jgi:mono/diheme cytochrome c family protein